MESFLTCAWQENSTKGKVRLNWAFMFIMTESHPMRKPVFILMPTVHALMRLHKCAVWWGHALFAFEIYWSQLMPWWNMQASLLTMPSLIWQSTLQSMHTGKNSDQPAQPCSLISFPSVLTQSMNTVESKWWKGKRSVYAHADLSVWCWQMVYGPFYTCTKHFTLWNVNPFNLI